MILAGPEGPALLGIMHAVLLHKPVVILAGPEGPALLAAWLACTEWLVQL